MFYANSSQFDKKANKIIKTALRYKAIKAAEDVQAILCANVFQDKGNYALCTQDAIIYGVAKMQIIVKTESYGYSAITSLAQSGRYSFVTLTIGGAQVVTLEVMADKEDAYAFINFVQSKIGHAEASSVNSVADEIKKFKELLDIGAITEAEYNAKKSQLLGITPV